MRARLNLPAIIRTKLSLWFTILAVSLLVPSPAALGQRISIGIVAGGYANKDFVSYYRPTPGFLPAIAISDAGGYLIGPTAEVRIHRGFSFAADALYKPLHYEMSATFYPDGRIGYAPATVVTWQFPLLARYRFSSSKIRPFLEGGPSFRAAALLSKLAFEG